MTREGHNGSPQREAVLQHVVICFGLALIVGLALCLTAWEATQ